MPPLKIKPRRNEALEQLVGTLEMQNEIKSDWVVSADKLEYRNGILHLTETTKPRRGQLEVSPTGLIHPYTPTAICHDQIATKLNIPRNYYQRMLAEFPTLLEDNINGWFKHMSKDAQVNYLLRTFNYTGTPVARKVR